MRYLAQPDKSSCVPIAIMNACKWYGLPVILADLKRYKKYCRWAPLNDKICPGSPSGIINDVLLYFFNKVLVCNDPKKELLDFHLETYGGVILTLRKDDFAHAFFIEKKKKNKYYVCNLYEKEALSVISNGKFYRECWRGYRKIIWMIKK